MQLTIRKFEPSGIGNGRVIMIIGKRNTGKSVLVKDIMAYKQAIKAGIVCSGTEEGNSYFGGWVPDCFIYNDFDKPAVQRLIDHQRKACKAGTARDVFLVLDDLMFDNSFLKDKMMRSIFMNGRHWKIFLVLTAQFAGDIPPAIRSNIDYVFILRENIIQNRERLYKNFFGIFPTFDSFCQTLDSCTENFECMVLDNTSRSNKIEDCLFWYKARMGHKFRMGSPDYWKYHKKNYNPKHDQAVPPGEVELRPSRKPKITINRVGS